jgi:NAD+ kinase
MEKAYVVTRPGLEGDSGIKKFLDILKKRYEVVPYPLGVSVIFVFGGDGTNLHAVKDWYGLNIPFCGFNFGRKGFLMNEATEEVAQEYLDGAIEIQVTRMLKVKIQDEYGIRASLLALNDFYIEKSVPEPIGIKIIVNGEVIFNPLHCNGTIVASPAGSTSYSRNCAGEILPIDSDEIVLTGIAPDQKMHNCWRSQLFKDKEIILEPIDTKRCWFMADGINLSVAKRALVSLSDQKVQLVFTKSQAYKKRMERFQF